VKGVARGSNSVLKESDYFFFVLVCVVFLGATAFFCEAWQTFSNVSTQYIYSTKSLRESTFENLCRLALALTACSFGWFCYRFAIHVVGIAFFHSIHTPLRECVLGALGAIALRTEILLREGERERGRDSDWQTGREREGEREKG